jgi:hypothetical protein
LNNPDESPTPQARRVERSGASVDAVLANASHYAPCVIQVAKQPPSAPKLPDADRTDPCPLDSLVTVRREALSDDAASAALFRVEGTQELAADDILEVADKLDEVSSKLDAKDTLETLEAKDTLETAKEPTKAAPPEPPTLESLPPAADSSAEIAVEEEAAHEAALAPANVPPPAPVIALPAPPIIVPPPAPVVTAAPVQVAVQVALPPPAQRLGAEDTWQALGRAIGEAQPNVVVAAPAAPDTVPQRNESFYPLEVPAASPAQMSAPFASWPFAESIAEASMSIAVAIRKPRALRTARLAVGGVSAFAALVCIVAVIVSATRSTGSADLDAVAKTQAASAPPPAAQSIPSKQAVREDRSFASDIATASGQSSWAKNVMGDAPGVSIDNLPSAPNSSKGGVKRAAPPPRSKHRRLPQ